MPSQQRNSNSSRKQRNAIRFLLNNEDVRTELPAGTLVLDYLRRVRGLTGTKEGCREGDCGACTVLLGTLQDNQVQYRAVASCLLPLGGVAGKHLVTIEGLATPQLTPIQQAIVDEGASQCGFCTPGVVLSLTGFLLRAPSVTTESAVRALDGNICRCTGYAAIKRAAARVATEAEALLRDPAALNNGRLRTLVEAGYLPEYFLEVPHRLRRLQREESPRLPIPPAVAVGGGTDLFVQKPQELLDAPLRFLLDEPGLSDIQCDGQTCTIGAAATVADLLESPALTEALPELQNHLDLVSSTLIRNRATVGGNLVNASPIGDLSILFLALGAEVLLSSDRTVPLEDFFLGYKRLALRPGEVVQAVRFHLPERPYVFNFEKVSKRRHLDIASVNSAALLRVDEQGEILQCRISAGGVAPVPLFLRKTSAFLEKAVLSRETVLKAANLATTEISPITDVRGSARYKELLLRQLILAHFAGTELQSL